MFSHYHMERSLYSRPVNSAENCCSNSFVYFQVISLVFQSSVFISEWRLVMIVPTNQSAVCFSFHVCSSFVAMNLIFKNMFFSVISDVTACMYVKVTYAVSENAYCLLWFETYFIWNVCPSNAHFRISAEIIRVFSHAVFHPQSSMEVSCLSVLRSQVHHELWINQTAAGSPARPRETGQHTSRALPVKQPSL